MKKYFILAVAAVAAMAACTKTEIDQNVVPDQKIAFEVANYAQQTKANVALASDDIYSFHTHAYQFPEIGNPVSFMNVDILPWHFDGSNRTQVTKPGANETAATIQSWAPEQDYFWPKTGYINFYSFAGTASPTVAVNNGDNEDWKTVTFTYTDEVIDANSNILVADAALHYGIANAQNAAYNLDNSEGSGHVTKGVPTLFRHQLTKIIFDVRARTAADKVSANTSWRVQVLGTYTYTPANEEVTIKSAINPIKKGSLLLTNEDDVNSAQTKEWARTNASEANISGWVPSSAAADKEEIVFTGTADIASAPAVLTIPVNAIQATQNDNPLDPIVLVAARSVMPQVTSGVKFTLVYRVQALHGNVIYLDEIRTVGISADASLSQLITSVPKWEANKKITYHIIIDPVSEKVTFDPAIEDWEPENNGDNINVNNGGLVANS